MSGPVDVLAVMDDAAATLGKVAQIQMDERAEEMREARAAVAELIAAANMAAEWIDEARRKGTPAAITLPRLNAALARIGGVA